MEETINRKKTGKVYIVGAGPGDPGLITVKGVSCIKEADVIIYDHLAPVELLEFAQEAAELIYAGKQGGAHTLSQDDINDLLVRKAKAGYVVVRLKGGDPFIFGRGGEEARVLATAGIPFEIVPGVTSAIAAPAYAGIPITHRRYNSTIAFIAGHEDPTKEGCSINWSKIATGVGTLIFLMGVKNLPYITNRLIDGGRDPDTPVAVIRWASTPKQITVTGTLKDIVRRSQEAGIGPPAVIVVGEVVSLRKELNWFESRPLFGKTVIVTRTREQASELTGRLKGLGAECVEFPTIKLVPTTDWSLLDRAIDTISSYDWLIFTSVNGVRLFFQRLYEKGKDVRALNSLLLGAIGSATSESLARYGIRVDTIPETYRAEGIVDALAKEPIKGKRFLLPRAKDARSVLPQKLREMGALVDEIPIYHTEVVREKTDDLKRRLKEGTIDLLTFTSSSTVRNFRALFSQEEFESLCTGPIVACIGPITAETAKDLGLQVHIVPEIYTIPALCDSIERYFNAQKC
nr:uroporphyrinogen-III C-methyltransferase [Desulfobacterales bacterium]